MFKKIALAISLSALVLTPVHAADDDQLDVVNRINVPVVENLQAMPIVALESVHRTAGQVAYQAFDGSRDVAYGVGQVAQAGGRLIKNGAQLVVAGAEVVTGLGCAVAAVPNYLYDGKEAANKNLAHAKGNVVAAYDNLKNVITDAPKNYTNLKDGVVQTAQGAKKIGSALYEVGRAAVESKPGQAVISGVKATGAKVGSFFSGLYSLVSKGYGPVFKDVDFS